MSFSLEDELYLFKNKYFTYHVKLNLEFLSYTPNSSLKQNNIEVKELIEDLVGCSLMKSSKNKSGIEVFLKIWLYPLIGLKKKKRKKKTIIFEISQRNSFEENLEIANKWRSLIYYAMHYAKGTSQMPLYKFQKTLLIFVNPKSGPGVALEIFNKSVQPLLSEAEVNFDLVITDRAKHAYELIQHKDLGSYTGIVVVAGDGLIYEIYNGIFQRNDSDLFLSIPIGVIPGGSGNGLASSISHSINEPYLSNPVLVSTLNITNPVASPLDLVLLQTQLGQNLISFLSVGFGILSDIDIESERLRALGEARFSLYGVARILKLRKYKVKLSYKIAFDVAKVSGVDKKDLCHLQFIKEESYLRDFPNKRKTSSKSRPTSLTYSNSNEGITIEELVSEASLEPVSLTMANKSTFIKEQRSSTNGDAHQRLVTDSMINLKDPVPPDWVTIEDEFISIYAVNQPYIGSTALFSPKSTLNDGVLWLCFIRGDMPRSSVLKFLLALDYGTHVNVPGVTYLPVTEVRIVPCCSSGKITVDGELIEFGPVQASVLPGKGRIMVRRS